MFVTSVVQFWSEWGLRISVLGSLAAYTILALLSGTRRRSASGRSAVVLKLILWAAYQAAELAATAALGSLSLSGSDASTDEQQLIAFWAPFLLLHLGGPDNMTAYTLEDNILSLRKGLEMILQLLGVMYAIWNFVYRSHSWVLLGASVIMLVTGGVRYVERAWALWRANLDNMQHSSKKEPAWSGISSSTSTSTSSSSSIEVVVEFASSRSLGRDLDDDEALSLAQDDDDKALLLAQDLFHTWRRALVDSSVDPGSPSQHTSEKILSLPWRTMCKVVEMELSLMYEVLYTKASLAHTCQARIGYLAIRLMSPSAYAAAGWLFWLYSNKEGRQLRGSFVPITYLLLCAAFTMDVVWLLRALGSTWTYYLLKEVQRWPWACFHRKVLCSGMWLWLHRAVVYLDPLRLVFSIDPVRHRRWSGTIGRYNLLDECTTVRRRPWCLWLATKAGLEETRYLSELDEGVKELLFKRVQRIVPTADNPSHPDGAYTMVRITTRWGQEALKRGKRLFTWNEQPISGREFEQDVLAWHIATRIFLPRIARRIPAEYLAHVEAIEVMSEYLMFLVAVRRQMLPGLILHSLLEETRETLYVLWDGGKGASLYSIDPAAANKDKLATILRRMRNNNQDWALHNDGRRLVLDAVEIAGALTKSSRYQHKVPQLLELVFNIWVDKLLYAGVRCSRESHAKQLSAGGELTTVLWMTVQHAGLFRIGEKKPDYGKVAKQDLSKKGEKKKAAMQRCDDEPAKPRPVPELIAAAAPVWEVPSMSLFGSPYGIPEEYGKHPIAMAMAPPPQPVEVEPIPEGEDPEDAAEYDMPINYVTLY
ncbi:unnamed protein product [Urochloa humidicola]